MGLGCKSLEVMINFKYKINCCKSAAYGPFDNEHSTLNQAYKVLDQSRLKTLTDNKIKVIQSLKFVLGRQENIVEKGENAGYQHFLIPQCFQNPSPIGSLKVEIVW